MLHGAIVVGTVCGFVIVVVVLWVFWDIEGGVVLRGEVHIDRTLATLQKQLDTLKT